MHKSVSATLLCLIPYPLSALADGDRLSLEEVKEKGALRSSYRNQVPLIVSNDAPQANLEVFHSEIEPLLKETCFQCHGPKKQKGEFRIDTLNPNLIKGSDADWWLDVLDALNISEMPPEDEDVELADENRSRIKLYCLTLF